MSYLLEILGRGLLTELSGAFGSLIEDDGHFGTHELEAAVAREPDDPGHHRRLGVRMLSLQDARAAERSFRRALALAPDDPAARVALACVQDAAGSVHEALETLAAARDAKSDSAIRFAQGFCHEKLGQIDEAVAAYEDVIDIHSEFRAAHERLAAIALKRHELDTAIVHYEHLCWADPSCATTNMTLANLYIRAGRYDDAIQRYRYVTCLDPSNWEARDDLAAVYDQTGQYAKAIPLLLDLIDEEPGIAQHRVRLGDLYVRTGAFRKALGEFRKAVELGPDYLEAFIKLGVGHLRGGDVTEAMRWFGRAIEINDQLLAAYVGLGVAQQEAGRTDEARESFDIAAAVEPNSTLLFSEIARLQLGVSAAGQVERYLAPSAMARGESPPARERVDAVIVRQIERLRETLEARPNHADLHFRLGLLLRQTGDLDAGIASMQRAVEINPCYLRALIKLGVCLREKGDHRAAIDAFRRALRVDGDAVDAYYELGVLYADQRRYESAVNQFEQAASRRPDRVDLHAHLAMALENLGLSDRAETNWRTLFQVAPHTPSGRAALRAAFEPSDRHS